MGVNLFSKAIVLWTDHGVCSSGLRYFSHEAGLNQVLSILGLCESSQLKEPLALLDSNDVDFFVVVVVVVVVVVIDPKFRFRRKKVWSESFFWMSSWLIEKVWIRKKKTFFCSSQLSEIWESWKWWHTNFFQLSALSASLSKSLSFSVGLSHQLTLSLSLFHAHIFFSPIRF